MDRTVVSSTGTTVRRRNAGRTRNTRGKSIFTGAVRARSAVAARARLTNGRGELRRRLGERRPEGLGPRERRHRAPQIGQIEAIGERSSSSRHRAPRSTARTVARTSSASGPGEPVGGAPERQGCREPGRGARGQEVEQLRDLGVDSRAQASTARTPRPPATRRTEPAEVVATRGARLAE